MRTGGWSSPCCRGRTRASAGVVNGIYHVVRTGARWRDLPKRHGPCTTVSNRFDLWSKRGVWQNVVEEPARRAPQSMPLIESSIIRGSPARRRGQKAGSDHAIGHSRGGLTTRIHAVVDQDGPPVRLLLTAGQASDKTVATLLLGALPPAQVVADRGHDSMALVGFITECGGEAHIPTQSRMRLQRCVGRDLYGKRNLVERVFCRLEQFRRTATCVDKHADTFLAAVALASTRIWIRTIESAP
ncbi:IS5 family transposase [Rhodovulum viride]|uniref:IS5 family transposase n=1 Tax=Rhodovulum viride TaxID=1231134 RepID=UPI000DD48690|nr:IS5 family transposase [Rhodovulum viride]